MKKLAILSLVVLFASCQKNKNITTVATQQVTPISTTTNEVIAAKINNRQWQSAAKTTATASDYLAAIKDGTLQIKTYGSFTDSMGTVSNDQLGIYIDGVTDTGRYTLSASNYIVYNQLLATPQYYSSQIANIGFLHITSLTDTTISGNFECQVDNTSGTGITTIRDGAFSNIHFQ